MNKYNYKKSGWKILPLEVMSYLITCHQIKWRADNIWHIEGGGQQSIMLNVREKDKINLKSVISHRKVVLKLKDNQSSIKKSLGNIPCEHNCYCPTKYVFIDLLLPNSFQLVEETWDNAIIANIKTEQWCLLLLKGSLDVLWQGEDTHGRLPQRLETIGPVCPISSNILHPIAGWCLPTSITIVTAPSHPGRRCVEGHTRKDLTIFHGGHIMSQSALAHTPLKHV